MSLKDISHFERMNQNLVKYDGRIYINAEGAVVIEQQYQKRLGFIIRKAWYDFRLLRLKQKERRYVRSVS